MTTTVPKMLHVFPTFRVGGAQNRFVTIVNGLDGAFRHVLLAMDGEYECSRYIDTTVNITNLEVSVRKGHPLVNRKTFRAALRAVMPDVLVTYNWGSTEWALANWPKLVRHVHVEDGFGPDEANRQLARRVWTRRLALRGSTVVVPSQNLFRIATTVWHLDPRRVRYVPNGIDCARFGAGIDAPQSAERDAVLVVGTVAALRAEKNLARLIEAFHLVTKKRRARLVIAGDGPERPGLEEAAQRLGIADLVTFAGHVPDPRPLYSTFDVFALSSDTEQMPYAVLEAMAAGLPVVATDVGDIRTMVAVENQRFVVPRAARAMGDAMVDLLGDADARSRLGKANRSKAFQEFDQARMVSAYADLFRDRQ